MNSNTPSITYCLVIALYIQGKSTSEVIDIMHDQGYPITSFEANNIRIAHIKSMIPRCEGLNDIHKLLDVNPT